VSEDAAQERSSGAPARPVTTTLAGETFGIGLVLAAVGFCCVGTFASALFGTGAIAGLIAFVAGAGWLAVPLALIAAVGLVWLGLRRRRAVA